MYTHLQTSNNHFSHIPTNNVVNIHDLSIAYKSTGINILNNINITLTNNEMVALSGPSGLGKSTLFKAIIGDPQITTSGGIEIFGKNMTMATLKNKRLTNQRIAYIQQSFNIIDRLTVLDNVLSGAYDRMSTLRIVGRQYPKHIIDEALSCLEKVGMVNKSTDICQNLSGGQKQRVAIARVMMQKAKLVLADEPIASLDAENAEIVFNHLQALRDDGIAVCIILHQPFFIQRCDREINIREFSQASS